MTTVVYFHGGAGLFGSPASLNPRHRNLLEGAGLTVVAPAYPKAIARPIQHTLASVAGTLSGVAAQAEGDLVVMGHSFGGYLALWLAATQAEVDRAVAFAGYGDLLADWYLKPSAHYLAYKELGDFDPASVTPDAPTQAKLDLYLYLRQTGTWPDYVAKGDPASLAALSPLNLPPPAIPIWLIHAKDDTDVPYTASVAYYEHIRAASPESRLILRSTGGHRLLSAMDEPEVTELWEEVVAFCATGR